MDPTVTRGLKGAPSGEEAKALLRERMKVQLESPESDPMTLRLLPALELCRPMLNGRIVDVGCYTGFLYHALGKPDYTGIDIWPEAIAVAKEFAPKADFRVADGFKFEGHFDVLWCSQIVWHGDCGPTVAIEKLSRLAKKSIFVLVGADVRGPFPYKSIPAGQLNIVTIGE